MPYACASSKWNEIPSVSDVSIDARNGYSPSNKSIKLYQGVSSGPHLSLTTDHMSLSCSLDFGVIQ